MNDSMNDPMNDSIDNLCEKMNYTQVENQPSYNFMTDINIIIDEIIFKIQKHNLKIESEYFNENSISNQLEELDIYTILVSCGHALTWEIEYNLSQIDFNWLKTEGKEYFLNKIGLYLNLNIPSNYYKILPCYIKLVELYELQVVE